MQYDYVAFNAHVFSGLPVTVEAVILPPDPGVGIMGNEIGDMRLYWQGKRRGKLREFSEKLYKRVTRDEWRHLEDVARTEVSGGW